MVDDNDKPLTGKKLEQLLRKYLVAHSNRRLNYLYWNATNPKDTTLSFVNLSGEKLTTLNNSDLVFRVVRVRNSAEWRALQEFIVKYLIDPEDARATHVIRIDYLMSYLKTIGFNPDAIKLERNAFGTAKGILEDEQLSKPLCTIDTDVHSLILVDKLYRNYRKLLYNDTAPELEIADILQNYLDDKNFRYLVDDLKVAIPVTENLDVPGRKYIRAVLLEDPNTKLEQIYLKNGLSTVVSRFVGGGLHIVTVRVYLQYFLSKYRKKTRDKQDG